MMRPPVKVDVCCDEDDESLEAIKSRRTVEYKEAIEESYLHYS
jgi:hypothetical protein